MKSISYFTMKKKMIFYLFINMFICICVVTLLSVFQGHAMRIFFYAFLHVNLVNFPTFMANDIINSIIEKKSVFFKLFLPLLGTIFINYLFFELISFLVCKLNPHAVVNFENKYRVYILSFLTAFTFSIYSFYSRDKDSINNKISDKNLVYNPLDVHDKVKKQEENIIEYIAQNYHNSELSLDKISEGCQINCRQISPMLYKRFNLTFSQYLNKIRLTEAKRLLENTSNPVIEIAFGVGFNSISHFNRIFRKAEQISPTEYRKKNNKPAMIL